MSLDASLRPKLRRPLNISREKVDSRTVVVIRDPEGLNSDPAVVPEPLMAVVARFDGLHTLDAILQEFQSHGLTAELLHTIVRDLEALSLLETEAVRTSLKQLREDFANAAVRPAALAGAAYPNDPEVLRSAIQQHIQSAATGVTSANSTDELVALICPHIDYRRGGATYGRLFADLEASKARERVRPDVVFLLGTSHQAGTSYFQFTKKNFACPLGEFQTAVDVVDSICRRYDSSIAFRDEYLHKSEHSLELQLPFLAHGFGPQLPALVPILVGSFHEFLQKQQQPESRAEVADFIESTAETIQSLRLSGKRVLLYGGVDLAHMGQHFGDKIALDPTKRSQIEALDRALLDAALRTDANAVLEHMGEDLDARRICGFPTIYSMLRILEHAGIRSRGTLLEYRQAYESRSDCLVSFAGAVWHEHA